MKVFIFEAADWLEAENQGLSKEAVAQVVQSGLSTVKDLLPNLSNKLNIAVRPYFQGIIPEYGTGARTWDSEFIEIWFDKAVPHGVEKTLKSISQTVFHECSHAVRWNSITEDSRLLESAIFEGLATVFEREYAGYQPLYGSYENKPIMQNWLEEIRAAGSDWSKREELFFDNNDGRRWVSYKTGTWIVDTAIKKSGQSVIQLTPMTADKIIELAGL